MQSEKNPAAFVQALGQLVSSKATVQTACPECKAHFPSLHCQACCESANHLVVKGVCVSGKWYLSPGRHLEAWRNFHWSSAQLSFFPLGPPGLGWKPGDAGQDGGATRPRGKTSSEQNTLKTTEGQARGTPSPITARRGARRASSPERGLKDPRDRGGSTGRCDQQSLEIFALVVKTPYCSTPHSTCVLHTHVHTLVCAHMPHTCMHILLHGHTQMYTHTRSHGYTHSFTYTYAHTHVDTCMHTHAHGHRT